MMMSRRSEEFLLQSSSNNIIIMIILLVSRITSAFEPGVITMPYVDLTLHAKRIGMCSNPDICGGRSLGVYYVCIVHTENIYL